MLDYKVPRYKLYRFNAKDNFSRIYNEYKNRNLDEYLRYLFCDVDGIVL